MTAENIQQNMLETIKKAVNLPTSNDPGGVTNDEKVFLVEKIIETYHNLEFIEWCFAESEQGKITKAPQENEESDGTAGRKRTDIAYAQAWIEWQTTGVCPWKNPREMRKHPPKQKALEEVLYKMGKE